MEQMNPIVPKIRMGGMSLWYPVRLCRVRCKATEFDNANVAYRNNAYTRASVEQGTKSTSAPFVMPWHPAA